MNVYELKGGFPSQLDRPAKERNYVTKCVMAEDLPNAIRIAQFFWPQYVWVLTTVLLEDVYHELAEIEA